MTPEGFNKAEYEKVFTDVYNVVNNLKDSDKSAYAGCMVRAAGHDFMDFRVGKKRDQSDATGGSDGCFNFNDPDNKGLKECLTKFDVNTLYNKWCHKLSLADFFVLHAESVMGILATDFDAT